MYNHLPTKIPEPILISISKNDCQTLQILKEMLLSSQKQPSIMCSSTVRSPSVNEAIPKLFSPLVYPQISMLCTKKQNSLHTLCCALQIYENYKQIITSLQSQNEMEELDIATVCLSISESINETLYLSKIAHILEGKERRMEKLKVEILQVLKWKVNYVTFACISEMFMSWIIPKIKENIKWFECDISVCKSHIYTMMEEFNFLTEKPEECSYSSISNILEASGIKIKESLRDIIFESTNQISITHISHNSKKFSSFFQTDPNNRLTVLNSNSTDLFFLPNLASKDKSEQINNNFHNFCRKEFNFDKLTHSYTNCSKTVKKYFQPIQLFLSKDENLKENSHQVSTH